MSASLYNILSNSLFDIVLGEKYVLAEAKAAIDHETVEKSSNVVRLSLQADGSDVSLVNIRDDGIVELSLNCCEDMFSRLYYVDAS